jgi:hypothetical protein
MKEGMMGAKPTARGLREGVGAEVYVFGDGQGDYLVRPAQAAVHPNERILFWNMTKSSIQVCIPGIRRVLIGAGGEKGVLINKPRGVYPYAVLVEVKRGLVTRARGESPPWVIIRP